MVSFQGSRKATPTTSRVKVAELKAPEVICSKDEKDRGIISPITAVLKNSDKIRANTLVGIKIVDQTSLDEANRRLLLENMLKVNLRLCNDLSFSLINSRTLSS